MTTTPKPRHGWLSAPSVPGWWWVFTPSGSENQSPIKVTGSDIDNRLYDSFDWLWHPCLPPAPPVDGA